MSLSVAQIKERIKNIANKTGSDARFLMRIYMMERFIDRLSCSEYKDNFIFKGGILVTSMVGIAMRSTMDIDTSIKNINLSIEDVMRIAKEISKIDLGDGIIFDVKKAEEIMDNFEYPGIRIEIDAVIGEMITPFKIDISTGDVITPREINYEYKLLIEDRTINIWAYNLETVLAEKLQTILARNVLNTRMRDFYDVYALLEIYGEKIDYNIFRNAFEFTSKKRNSEFKNIEEQIQMIASSSTILNLWEQYQKKYSYASAINFESVIKTIEFIINKI